VISESWYKDYGISIVGLNRANKATQNNLIAEVSGTYGSTGRADNVLVLTGSMTDNKRRLRSVGRHVPVSGSALTLDTDRLSFDDIGTWADHSPKGEELLAVTIVKHLQPGPMEISRTDSLHLYIVRSGPLQQPVEKSRIQPSGIGLIMTPDAADCRRQRIS
jgi:hypothetical protein